MFGELIVVPDVAGAFATRVFNAWRDRPRAQFSLVLSGGETARRCYERLADGLDGAIDWATVDVFWGDERCVPATDPDSNQRLAREALLDRVGPLHGIHPMDCAEGAAAYDALWRTSPRPDLIHLGLGPDGHTASLFPNSVALGAGSDELVTTNVDPTGRNPHPRMSLTLAGIRSAYLVVVTAEGPTKRAALRAVMNDGDVPAGRVRAERVEWIVDQAAASQEG